MKGAGPAEPRASSIAALPFPLAYEVSCRTRTGSVRRNERTRSAISPCFLRNGWFPRVTQPCGHEQLRQTSEFSTWWSYSRHQREATTTIFETIAPSTVDHGP